jgi:peroxiredoxin
MKQTFLIAFLFLSLSSFAQDISNQFSVGDKAPSFAAKDQNGKVIKSKQILKEKELILVFYRGQWCPYCNRHLMHLEENIEKFTQAGAQLVAISPELPSEIDKTLEKTKSSYPILFDKDSKIMKKFGVDFVLDKKTQKRYKKYGVDLEKANGNSSQTLPVPATYIIGKDGKIKYMHFDPKYSNRSTAEEILKHL